MFHCVFIDLYENKQIITRFYTGKSMIHLELLTQLSEEYPNGVSFEPLALRILCQKMSLNETQVETLKTELFQMKNGLWYHQNMILSIERQSLFEGKIREYFERYKLFSVAQLLAFFEGTLRHIKNVQDCALFLQYLGYSVEVWHRKHQLCVASRHTYINVLESVSHSISKYLESSNGTVSKEDICEKLPQFSVEVLDDIRTVFLPNVLETEISDTLCWSTVDTLILPEDFSERLSFVVNVLVSIGRNISVANITFALDLSYEMRFREEYSLEDDDVFKKICKSFYNGEHNIFSREKHTGGESAKRSRSFNTRFDFLKIPIGERLTFVKDINCYCTVLNEINMVEYEGKPWAISSLAQHLTGAIAPNGFKFFKYNGENLYTRRLRIKSENIS